MTTLRFDRRMSDQDALMWSIEKDPLLRSTITSVMLLDGAIDRERFVETIERASREVPRLRQKVVTTPLATAPPEFVVDPNFDIDYHLRFQKAPGSGTVRNLLDYAGPFAMAGFDRDRPLWEYVFMEDMADGRSALVSKVHHALTDGVGGMEMLLAILDTSPEGEDRGPMPPAPEAEQPPLGELVTDGLAHEGRRNLGIASRVPRRLARALLDPVGTARQTAELAASAGRMMRPVSEPMSPIMNERSLSVHFDTITASLPDLKAAAKAAGGRLNDAFVAAVAGGLRRYHDEHGVTVEQLRMTMPINIRPDTDEVVAGNQFVPARFVFPVGIADPADRIRALHDLVTNQREEPAMSIVDPISGVLNRLPLGLATNVLGGMLKAIDVVTSNVSGAPFPIYLAGAKVEANFGFGPLSGAATNITLLSYIDELHITVSTDPAAVPDPDTFTACLEAGIDEIVELGR